MPRRYKKRAKPAEVYVWCSQHGRMPWQHVMCKECGRLYDLKKATVREDGFCDCGKPLMPEADEVNFTARAVCFRCALLLEQVARCEAKKKREEEPS